MADRGQNSRARFALYIDVGAGLSVGCVAHIQSFALCLSREESSFTSGKKSNCHLLREVETL